ncbi:MAG: RICIN domain-containing protein [Muribaculum sp.]|nr:RICIN domain-containing protein [Muribaculum sp.]
MSQKRNLHLSLLSFLALGATAQNSVTTAFDSHEATEIPHTDVFFDILQDGVSMPVEWGLDTAWPSSENMIRGTRYIGASNLSVARVSFQPWQTVTTPGSLPGTLLTNLTERMNIVGLIGHPVNIMLNSDPGDGTNLPATYRGNPTTWANLIDATAAEVERKGYTVVSASPFNEPDYGWGQGSKEDFLEIAKLLKDKTKYPRFENIRISGGNTLNCDEAHTWYDFLKDYLDEGNTHQLAGDFAHYADFFTKVTTDGKHATADELHNVMEAMVGSEYGMQTGVWWGTAERTRGEFCRATFGKRLAYAENRNRWTAASVYRNPDGEVSGFVGSSERQAQPSTYRFVSTARDVYFDGYGPTREYIMKMPGGYSYQNGQTNAEGMVRVTWGEDVAPAINGTYAIMNQATLKVIGIKGGSAALATDIVQQTHMSTLAWQKWVVEPVPNNIVGDFSYYFITSARDGLSMDVLDWSLDPTRIITYTHNKGSNQQWYLEYDGDGYFHIRSRHSTLCLEVADGSTSENAQIRQAEYANEPRQKWRLIPVDAPCETDAPSAPTGLHATATPGTVKLSWNASPEPDVEGYVILRAEGDSEEYNTIGRNVKGTEFIDNTALPEISYRYKIAATDRSLNRSSCSTSVETSPTGSAALLAQYTFEDITDDVTANGYKLHAYGNPAYDTGRTGAKSIKLNGSNNYLKLPYTLGQQKEMTLTAWVRWNGGSAWQRIFDFGNGENEYFFLTPSNGSKMRLVQKDGGAEQMIETDKLPVGEWTHIAVTIGDDAVRLYVNGILAADAPASQVSLRPSDYNPTLNYIGRSQFIADPLFSGVIDDLRIYNYPLSAEQVSQAMSGGTVGIGTVTDTESPREIKTIEYYNLQGQRISEPAMNGVTVVRTVFTDGTSSVSKMAK